jgi:hypothetical protein
MMKSLADLRVLLPAAADLNNRDLGDLNERARTLARGEGPYGAGCRALLAKAIPALAATLKEVDPPRGLEAGHPSPVL